MFELEDVFISHPKFKQYKDETDSSAMKMKDKHH